MIATYSKSSSFALYFVILVAVAWTFPAPTAWAIHFPGAPSSVEIDKYLLVGMRDYSRGVAVNVRDSELGANQEVVSSGIIGPGQRVGSYAGGLDLTPTFIPNPGMTHLNSDNRWDAVSPSNTVGIADTIPVSAPLFEGINFTGNIALTSNQGKFSMSNVDVNANIGVHTAQTSAADSRTGVRNTTWFSGPDIAAPGVLLNPDPNGVSTFNPTNLLGELASWKTFIQGLTAEFVITGDIINRNYRDSIPKVNNISKLDANKDGLAVIDIDRGDSDFIVRNTDWILDGDEGVFVIFRIRGQSNVIIENSSILIGDRGIAGGSSTHPVTDIGAIFFKGDEEGSDSSDQVFQVNNAILSGVGLWDLVTIGDAHATDNTTEIAINDSQGSAQFISSYINLDNTRFTKYPNDLLDGIPSPSIVPEPSSLLIWLGMGVVIFAFGLRRR
ncbi:MAG: PEP-CTERM sorting domain-containing protein [Pirellulales bacterium]|nr:PEP-CTERM sorting domain-containing protein [Pirellulales bacterium]